MELFVFSFRLYFNIVAYFFVQSDLLTYSTI